MKTTVPNMYRKARRWLTYTVLFLVAIYISRSISLVRRRWLSYSGLAHTDTQPIEQQDSHVQGDIIWTRCKDDSAFWCGFLDAPLDYAHPSGKRKVHLALRKYSATCEKNDYLGVLLINPGGPGASGYKFTKTAGRAMSAVVQGRYDIIGFDPRGVGQTTPTFGCSRNLLERGMAALQLVSIPSALEGRQGSFAPLKDGVTQLESYFYQQKFAIIKAMVQGCLKHADREVIESASTAYVARDMITILDAVKQYKLHYWGLSYGTAIGSTFAAMFPERVGRMVLDGTMNVQAYTNHYHDDISPLGDNERVLAEMSKQCALHKDACPAALPLWNEENSAVRLKDPENLIKNIEALARRLAISPMSVPVSRYGPGILTATALQRNLHRAMYWPAAWPRFAGWIAEALAGNGTALYDAFASENVLVQPANDNSNLKSNMPKETRLYELNDIDSWLVETMINCLDSGRKPPRTAASRIEYARRLAIMSHVGDYWAQLGWFLDECSVVAKEAYHGPWTQDTGLRKTAFPLLFIGNTFDNVTPLSSAAFMADGFGRDSAVLVHHDGYGHTSFAQPSLCTAKVVRAFLSQGTIPALKTKCEVQQSWPYVPFGYRTLGEEDITVLKELEALAKVLGRV